MGSALHPKNFYLSVFITEYKKNADINHIAGICLRPPLPFYWLFDLRFLLGFSLFLIGLFINLQSDYILRHLREVGESDYKIPFGGLFKYISCPNYLLSGFLFAFWTGVNLIPRAFKHHKWYHEEFSEYPEERKIIFPKFF